MRRNDRQQIRPWPTGSWSGYAGNTAISARRPCNPAGIAFLHARCRQWDCCQRPHRRSVPNAADGSIPPQIASTTEHPNASRKATAPTQHISTSHHVSPGDVRPCLPRFASTRVPSHVYRTGCTHRSRSIRSFLHPGTRFSFGHSAQSGIACAINSVATLAGKIANHAHVHRCH